jgi:hypothetical protein
MNGDYAMKPDDMTISAIWLRGNKALFDALGPVGFIRFMQQFVARGDYAKERQQWIDKIDLSDFKERVGATTTRKRKAV